MGQDRVKQLQQVQQYFGLRPQVTEPHAIDLTNRTWEEQEYLRKAQLRTCGIVLEPINLMQRVVYPFENSVVFVCIDAESYEGNHRLITEIGISILDTLDLKHIPPGNGGENWIKYIRSRHIRIKGREHLVNRDFCQANPDAFDFGVSEFIEPRNSANLVDSCFRWPFSIQFKPENASKQFDSTVITSTNRDSETTKPLARSNNGTSSAFDDVEIALTNHNQDLANKVAVAHILTNQQTTNPTVLPVPNTPNESQKLKLLQTGPKRRNLIVLGHAVGNDISYMKELGSRVFNDLSSTCPPLQTENNSAAGGKST